MKKLGNTPPVLFWFDGRSDLLNTCDLWWHCYWGGAMLFTLGVAGMLMSVLWVKL